MTSFIHKHFLLRHFQSKNFLLSVHVHVICHADLMFISSKSHGLFIISSLLSSLPLLLLFSPSSLVCSATLLSWPRDSILTLSSLKPRGVSLNSVDHQGLCHVKARNCCIPCSDLTLYDHWFLLCYNLRGICASRKSSTR